MPDTILPESVGRAALVRTDAEHSKEIRVALEVPADDTYYLLVEYFNLERISVPVKVRVEQADTVAEGLLLVNHCPYVSFCRELVSADGREALLGLTKSPPEAQVRFYLPSLFLSGL